MLSTLTFQINSATYLKDPESSDLGRQIVQNAIEMMAEMGYERFTFRKLAGKIGSTEASIYRYFESKQMLLVYLTCWYWRWMQYRLALGISNIPDPKDRLARAIKLLTEPVNEDSAFSHINEMKLSIIIINDSSKSYLHKAVDEINQEGVFMPYKNLVAAISDIVLEINPRFKYPHMLISTVIEGAHHQRFFAEHLPRLTDVVEGEDATCEFYTKMVFKTILD